MRKLFDSAIKFFGSIRVVNEFSKLPDAPGFEWGELRYVEIPIRGNKLKVDDLIEVAESLNISVEVLFDSTPKKIAW